MSHASHNALLTTNAIVTAFYGVVLIVAPLGLLALFGARREDIRVEASARRVVIAVLAPLTFPMRRVEGVRCAEFERAVQLPCEVRPEGANVRLDDGVLTIVLPKKATP
jgi:HSP20 family molecular chaperone IbpA